MSGHSHRPTLKQSNKPFKSKHATKSSIKEAAKGKVPRQTPANAAASKDASAITRLNRRNKAKQNQAKKRESLVGATRVFSGVDGAPRIVAVVPLCDDGYDTVEAVKLLVSCLDEDERTGSSSSYENGLFRTKAHRFKTSLQFIPLAYDSLFPTLDACKVADYVVFLLSPTTEVSQPGETLLRILQTQGIPSAVTLVLPTLPKERKPEKQGIMKSLLSFMQYFIPSQSRVFDLESPSERLMAVRGLSEGRPGDVRWRDGRAYLLGEECHWSPSENGEEGGTLEVTGIVRGTGFSADRLVHIPNHGDFQISKIMSAPLPRTSRHNAASNGTSMQIEPTLLSSPDPDTADSLVSTNDPDDLANEQTWPTEDEMNQASNGTHRDSDVVPDAVEGTTPRRIKKVPKGMSEYQAAWIVETSDEEDEDEGVDVGDDEEKETFGMGLKIDEDDQMQEVDGDLDVEGDDDDMATDGPRGVRFEDLPDEEDAQGLSNWRNRSRRDTEEETDLQFPDEIDTPQDTPASIRFARYRGLKSLRTSPWDPYENLPRDYARIFQFEDYKRTERGVVRRAGVTGLEPGTRVTLHIKNAPREAVSQRLTVFGLLEHEHKKTVLHYTVQRNTEFEGSVRSKDPLLLLSGPRRLLVNPIYSQHTRGGGKGVNNVHKFERYLRPGQTSVMSVYAPVCFGKQSCALVSLGDGGAQPELVAMGTFMSPDTTRVVAKRIVLTGHPFKVHKKTATVRYMFFNSDDIAYFKPIALTTKHGRTGHIKESLGTHGYYKAHFDGPVNQMDTVCMALYKRVFPRWCTLFKEGTSSAGADSGSRIGGEDERMEE